MKALHTADDDDDEHDDEEDDEDDDDNSYDGDTCANASSIILI